MAQRLPELPPFYLAILSSAELREPKAKALRVKPLNCRKPFNCVCLSYTQGVQPIFAEEGGKTVIVRHAVNFGDPVRHLNADDFLGLSACHALTQAEATEGLLRGSRKKNGGANHFRNTRPITSSLCAISTSPDMALHMRRVIRTRLPTIDRGNCSARIQLSHWGA